MKPDETSLIEILPIWFNKSFTRANISFIVGL